VGVVAVRGIGDYHSHTRWSDGQGSIAEVVAAAMAIGLPEIGVSDHVVPTALDDGFGLPLERLGEYAAEVRRVAATNSAPRVLLGVEVDFSPETWAAIMTLVRPHRPDYVIGAVHTLAGVAVDIEPHRCAERWPRADTLFCEYYETVAELAGAGGLDVVGHLDLPKKFGRRPSMAVRPAEDLVLDAIAAAGLLLELSTAGLRCPVAEPYPSLSLLTRARERGIRMTFGSDAHGPEHVGFALARAAQYARRAGYECWVRLSDRAEVELP